MLKPDITSYVINKCFITGKGYAVVFSWTYNKSYKYIKYLVDIAKKDFPRLNDHEIRVMSNSGGLISVEFDVFDNEIPISYKYVNMLPF